MEWWSGVGVARSGLDRPVRVADWCSDYVRSGPTAKMLMAASSSRGSHTTHSSASWPSANRQKLAPTTVTYRLVDGTPM